MFAHLNEPPPRLSDFRPELPQAFDDVFATALAKSPEERYATCGDLVAAARAALRGEAPAHRAGSRRRRAAVVAGAALVVSAAAISGVLATRDGGPPRRVGISQSAIAGATLGRTEAAYKKLYGPGWRSDILTVPNFPALIFASRQAVDLLRAGHRAQHHRHDLEPGPPDDGRRRPLLEPRRAQVRLRQRAEAVPLEHAGRTGLCLHRRPEPAVRVQRPSAEPLEAGDHRRAVRRQRAGGRRSRCRRPERDAAVRRLHRTQRERLLLTRAYGC